MEVFDGQIHIDDILDRKECNFPIICGRNKYTCCSECSTVCSYKCELDNKECGNYE